MTTVAALNLSDLKPGQHAVIERIGESGAAAFRLLELGLLPGTPVRYVRSAPMGGPLEIQVRSVFYSLRQSEAARIQVRPV